MPVTDGAENYLREIKVVQKEIEALRNELRRFIDHANSQKIEMALSGLGKEYASLFVEQHLGDAERGLQERMIRDCPMRDQCYATFYDFLKSSAELIGDGEVREEVVRSYRDRLAKMREEGRFENCSTCFAETNRLFEKQIDLMRSLGIYQGEEDTLAIADLPGDTLVQDFLEPLANRHRFRIVQSLATGTQTFSEISTLTGLKGGNLLFHLKKLQDAGMILQQHERGDYIITGKGYRALKAIGALQSQEVKSTRRDGSN